MKFSVQRYSLMLFLILFLIVMDLCINTFYSFTRHSYIGLLFIFTIQDIGIVLTLLLLLLCFFSTYVFKAGLIELLYDRFRLTIIIQMLYFFLTLVLHVFTLVFFWNTMDKYISVVSLQILFAFQRLVAPIHYYFLKRSVLRISDPRFYEDINWITNQLKK